ncbi:MAG: diguanylate cyclase/phosphodiesterase & domain with sensor(s) [Acidimicrobiales bacterium]|nr:diguanylate cyclase/phosphodiesterase & domain with sensor(s) [Acidimicrobiales bacterium]
MRNRAVTRTTRTSANRGTVDLVILAIGCVVLAVLAVRFRFVDALSQLVPHASRGLYDGLVTLVVLLPVSTVIYARRRYGEVVAVRRELVHLSLHDALTGLPNRRLLVDWLTDDIASSQRQNSQAAVLFVDLDRFKYVNDTHGHEVGDRLMRAVAERLREVARPEDRLIRFGGDEFVILAPGLNGSPGAEKLAREAIRVIEVPFTVGDESLRISASVGVALAEHRGVKPEDVLRDADVAMYQAKATGPGQVVVFDRSMTGRLTPATAEETIRAALEAGEFHLHYQPVVDLATGQIVGAEALLRWISQDRGTMSPAEFIPILEETGLIVPVGTWVLEEACREATHIRKVLGDHPPITVTVNVSARQIAQVGFGDVVANALKAADVGHGQIHLEITEGALMHDVNAAWAVLRQTKALGVKLALDDFGTGYSSLSYVRRFRLDMLKIDKSFIDGIDSSPEDRAIVEHVVGMADALGMTTVAEGVERPEQLAWLRRLGCRLAQGYALSRPLSADNLEALLRRRQHEPFEIGTVSTGPTELEIPALWGSPAAGDQHPAKPDGPFTMPEPGAVRPPFEEPHVPGPVEREPTPEPRPQPGAAARSREDDVDDAPLPPARPARQTGPALPRLREYRPPPEAEQQLA